MNERTDTDGVTNPTPTPDQLVAIEACREASRRYSYGVDRLDLATMRSAYWPDGTDDHGVFVGNAWDFCDRVVGSHDRWEWTMHTTANHRVVVDPDGNAARGEALAIAYLFDAGDRRLSTFYGRYLDEYQRRGDEWRILHRVCVHHGSSVSEPTEAMRLDVDKFRQASFDRPSTNRPIGP
jgi:hypothetical protein